VLYKANLAQLKDGKGNLILGVQDFVNAIAISSYTLVSKDQTVPGDFAIQGEYQHMGVCMIKGCDTVLSNSSTPEKFKWWSDPAFSNSGAYSKSVAPYFYHHNDTV